MQTRPLLANTTTVSAKVRAVRRGQVRVPEVAGALNLPRGKMTERKMAEWPEETLFVVYCAGPHCNGTDKAALRLATLGRKVKVMIGGVTGWIDEGFALQTA